MKTYEEIRKYHNEWRKADRRKRGLQKQGRKFYTEEQKAQAKINRKVWEKEWRLEYFEQNTEKKLYWAAKRRAKNKGLEFTIEESDITIPEYCPYLKVKLIVTNPRGSPRDCIASLDRIDSAKGYTKDNIEVISWLANTMKNNATVGQLQTFALEVLKRHPIV